MLTTSEKELSDLYTKHITSFEALVSKRVIGMDSGEDWVDLALDLMTEGKDSDVIIELSSSSPPYDLYELRHLIEKLILKSGLNVPTREQAELTYACYIMNQAIQGKLTVEKVINSVYEAFYGANSKIPGKFYSYYHARWDISMGYYQYYIDEALTIEKLEELALVDFYKFIEDNAHQI